MTDILKGGCKVAVGIALFVIGLEAINLALLVRDSRA